MSNDFHIKKILIGLVSQYKCLYDATSRNNCNQGMRDLAWMEIINKLAKRGVNTLTDPRGCWKSLRSNFTRHHKSQNKNWPHFEEMQFLVPHIKHKQHCVTPHSAGPIHTWALHPNAHEASTSSGYSVNPFMQQNFFSTANGNEFSHDNVGAYSTESILEREEDATLFSQPLIENDEMTMQHSESLELKKVFYEEHSYSQRTLDASNGILMNTSSNMGFQEESVPEVLMEEEVAEIFANDLQADSSNVAIDNNRKDYNRILHLDEDIVPLKCRREEIPDRRNVEFNIESEFKRDFLQLPQVKARKENLPSTSNADGGDRSFKITLGSTDLTKRKQISTPSKVSGSMYLGEPKNIHWPPSGNKDASHENFQTAFGSANIRKRNEMSNPSKGSGLLIVNRTVTKPVVPELDKFAKKKIKKNKKEQNDCEAAIKKCCESFLTVNKKSIALLTEKTVEARERRAERAQATACLPVQQVQLDNGFLNLLREDWNALNGKEQKELFFNVLSCIEDYARKK